MENKGHGDERHSVPPISQQTRAIERATGGDAEEPAVWRSRQVKEEESTLGRGGGCRAGRSTWPANVVYKTCCTTAIRRLSVCATVRFISQRASCASGYCFFSKDYPDFTVNSECRSSHLWIRGPVPLGYEHPCKASQELISVA